MIKLNKDQYYEKLIDYYYGHVHFVKEGPPSIFEWVEQDFGADMSRYSDSIKFNNEADATMFVLRWQ
jgi:hypothetical protein